MLAKLFGKKSKSRNHLDVAGRGHSDELKSIELGQEIQNCEYIIAQQREKCKLLTKALLKSSNGRNGQVTREIESLQLQLHTTQAAFNNLKQRTQQLEASASRCELTLAYPTKHEDKGPSSPLVEALMLDFSEGNNLVRRNSRSSQALGAAEDVLYGTRHPTAFRQDFAVSCPSLSSQNELVTSSTQTEEVISHNNRIYGNLQNSNSSSVSGVLDLDAPLTHPRSHVGNCLRKNFLKSIQRFDSESQTSQSIESTTDTDVSLPRQRSPSFLAAIEAVKCPITDTDFVDNNFPCTPLIDPPMQRQTFPRCRSSSFQAAIENGQRTPTNEQCDMDFANTINNNIRADVDFYFCEEEIGTDFSTSTGNVNNNCSVAKQVDHKTVSFVPSCYKDVKDINGDRQYLSNNPEDSNGDLCQQNTIYRTYAQLTLDQKETPPKYTSNKNAPSPPTIGVDIPVKLNNTTSKQTEAKCHSTTSSPALKRSAASPPRYSSLMRSKQNHCDAQTAIKTASPRQSPVLVENLSTSFEKDVANEKKSFQNPPEEKLARIVLESTFHDNGRVLTIFADDLNDRSETSSSSLPTLPSCLAKRASQEAPPVSVNNSCLSDSTTLPGPQIAYSPSLSTEGSRSPLLSEKSSLIAKNKQEGQKKPSLKNVPKTKGMGAARNLTKHSVDHYPTNNKLETISENIMSHGSAEIVVLPDKAPRDVSPKGKNSPLTRHLSIHDDSEEGRVSFTLPKDDEDSKETKPCHTEQTDQFSPSLKGTDSGRVGRSSTKISLSKIREGHLAKKREQLKHLTMPELSEVIEGAQNGACINSSLPTMLVTTGDGDAPSKSPAYPSLPDHVLESLGLSKPKQNSTDHLTAQEIEDKFARLSLAFKTDKLTLEKRLEIQERSRDLAEQNVEKELQGIKSVVDALIQLCDKEEMFELVKQLQHRLEILEQSTVRVSSRAEVYGAVQQENRMSSAMDVMVQHVENLKKVHEKEHIELQESRKFLQDNRVYSMQGSDLGSFENSSLSKRSLSLAGNLQLKGARRRNSVSVLPKMLGGSGAPFSLSQSNSMDSGMGSTSIQTNNSGEWGSQEQDPRTRFQCAVVNTTVRSAVTGAMRRTSIDRLPVILATNKQSVMSDKNDKSSELQKVSEVKSKPHGEADVKKSEEDAFQRGFEQGVRAHLGREMTELREQQQVFSDNLEDIMDDNELSPEEAECDNKDSVFYRIQQVCPKWEDSSQKIRLIMAGFVGLMAVFSMVFTILPVDSTNVTVSGQNNKQT